MLKPNTQKDDAVLTSLLENDAVPMSVLHKKYGALLKLVKVLIGVVPNSDPYLEIWPPAFRTYNIIVPNFMNLPSGIFGIGGAPKAIVGLGTYVASRSAACAYCSAHSCSFALRRGATPEKLANALIGKGTFTEQELATISVARSLASIPCELTSHEKVALHNCFTPSQAEWIILGIAMMGFLNKAMDTLGVELEAPTAAETQTILGANWSAGKAGRNLVIDALPTSPPKPDTLATKLSVIRYAPKALYLDIKWQKGVPSTWPEVGTYLRSFTGYDFPVLSRMHNRRAIKAVAAALRENLNLKTTEIGLDIKVLAGVVFTSVIANNDLAHEVRVVGAYLGLSAQQMDDTKNFAITPESNAPELNPKARAVLLLAKAAAPSPAQISKNVLAEIVDSKLSAAAIVELVSWLSTLQMLHRLSCFYNTDT